MNKKLVILLFSPIVLLLCISIYWMITSSIGKDVRIAVRGYDPRDLLSGHYIRYTIDWDNTDCSQFIDNYCPKDEFCNFENCKFYISENNAEQLDELLRYSDNDFSIIYQYKSAHVPIAKELLIDDKPWREFIEQNKKKNP